MIKLTWSGLFSVLAAIGIGVHHELYSSWITHDILCLAATIVLLEIIQMESFWSGVIFLLGMIWFDLFWMYGINLLSKSFSHLSVTLFYESTSRKANFTF